eukprot:6483892-Amphidinium_carterae.1
MYLGFLLSSVFPVVVDETQSGLCLHEVAAGRSFPPLRVYPGVEGIALSTSHIRGAGSEDGHMFTE